MPLKRIGKSQFLHPNDHTYSLNNVLFIGKRAFVTYHRNYQKWDIGIGISIGTWNITLFMGKELAIIVETENTRS